MVMQIELCTVREWVEYHLTHGGPSTTIYLLPQHGAPFLTIPDAGQERFMRRFRVGDPRVATLCDVGGVPASCNASGATPYSNRVGTLGLKTMDEASTCAPCAPRLPRRSSSLTGPSFEPPCAGQATQTALMLTHLVPRHLGAWFLLSDLDEYLTVPDHSRPRGKWVSESACCGAMALLGVAAAVATLGPLMGQ